MVKKISWVFYDSLTRTQSNPITTEEAQITIFKMREQDTVRFFIWTAGWEKWQPLKAYLESKQTNFTSAFSNVDAPEDTVAWNLSKQENSFLKMKPADAAVTEEITKSGYRSLSGISLEEDTILKDDHKFDSPHFDPDKIVLSSNPEKIEVDFKKLNKTLTLDSRADRHELKIEILLISSKGKTFRSKSKNISLSGSLLQDSIPAEYVGVSFDIVVINKQPCDPQFQTVSLRAKTVGQGLTQRLYYVNMSADQKLKLHKLLENYLETYKKLNKTG